MDDTWTDSPIEQSSAHTLVRLFLKAAAQPLAYNPEPKALFHQRGKALLAQIARDLGYREGTYDLRTNQGGIAVSGEITLHTDDLYVQCAQSRGGRGMDILYRDCAHRRDYTGGRNRFMAFDGLRDYDTALQRFTAARRRPANPAHLHA